MELVRRRSGRGGPLGCLHRDMDKLFGRFFEDWPLARNWDRAWWPALDIAEHDDKILVKAELPGVTAEDIDISVHEGMLTISGEKKHRQEDRGEGYYHVESRCGSFRRDIQLPRTIDPDKVTAAFRDGIVALPDHNESKAGVAQW